MAISARARKRVADRLVRLKARRTALRAEYRKKLDPLNVQIADEKAVLDAVTPEVPEQPEQPAP